MFYSSDIFVKRGKLATIWLAGTTPRKLKKRQVMSQSITAACAQVANPPAALALRTRAILLKGITTLQQRQAGYAEDMAMAARSRLRTQFLHTRASIDLPREGARARRRDITMPDRQLDDVGLFLDADFEQGILLPAESDDEMDGDEPSQMYAGYGTFMSLNAAAYGDDEQARYSQIPGEHLFMSDTDASASTVHRRRGPHSSPGNSSDPFYDAVLDELPPDMGDVPFEAFLSSPSRASTVPSHRFHAVGTPSTMSVSSALGPLASARVRESIIRAGNDYGMDFDMGMDMEMDALDYDGGGAGSVTSATTNSSLASLLQDALDPAKQGQRLRAAGGRRRGRKRRRKRTRLEARTEQTTHEMRKLLRDPSALITQRPHSVRETEPNGIKGWKTLLDLTQPMSSFGRHGPGLVEAMYRRGVAMPLPKQDVSNDLDVPEVVDEHDLFADGGLDMGLDMDMEMPEMDAQGQESDYDSSGVSMGAPQIARGARGGFFDDMETGQDSSMFFGLNLDDLTQTQLSDTGASSRRQSRRSLVPFELSGLGSSDDEGRRGQSGSDSESYSGLGDSSRHSMSLIPSVDPNVPASQFSIPVMSQSMVARTENGREFIRKQVNRYTRGVRRLITLALTEREAVVATQQGSFSEDDLGDLDRVCVSFDQVLESAPQPELSRLNVTRAFRQLLTLVSLDVVSVSQSEPYEAIMIGKGDLYDVPFGAQA